MKVFRLRKTRPILPFGAIKSFPKKVLAVPLFVLMICAGLVFVYWGSTVALSNIEAMRDAEAFYDGRYDSNAWVKFNELDVSVNR